MSVQYTTTELEERTMAFRPIGGMSGVMGSGGASSVVRTFSYFGGPSPRSLLARKLITYSEFGSTQYSTHLYSLIKNGFSINKILHLKN